MKNAIWLFVLNLKLAMGCNYILEIGVRNYKESVVMVNLLAMIDCACDI